MKDLLDYLLPLIAISLFAAIIAGFLAYNTYIHSSIAIDDGHGDPNNFQYAMPTPTMEYGS